MSPTKDRFVYWAELGHRLFKMVAADSKTESIGPLFIGLIHHPIYSPEGYPSWTPDGLHFRYIAVEENLGVVYVIDNVIQKNLPEDF